MFSELHNLDWGISSISLNVYLYNSIIIRTCCKITVALSPKVMTWVLCTIVDQYYAENRDVGHSYDSLNNH